jgi:hypothetical protein
MSVLKGSVMNLVSKLRWALIAASLVSGSALAATINCDVTPHHSVIADGETLQLGALCTGGSLSSIELLMNGSSVSGVVDLSNHAAGETVYFTSPVGLAASGAVFTVDGTPASTSDVFGTSAQAKVVVKAAAGSVAATTTGFAATSAQPASCGTADGGTFSSFPAATACATGSTSSLVVTGPTSFSWSCLSLTGGTEASCYAARGVTYTVTATDNGSSNGNVGPASQQVAGGSSATVTATPNNGYNTSWSSTCGGTPSGNLFTTNAVNANCTVTASFSTAPAAINGSCGTSAGQSFASAPTTGLCSAGSASGVSTGTSYTWSCTGSNGGNTASCSASISAPPPPPPVGDDPGVGSGLWVPAGTSNRVVADAPNSSTVSYVPGCLNGQTANNSYSGCAANSSYTGTIAGTSTPYTVSLGSGREVMIRYQPKPGAGTEFKYFRVRGATGTNVNTSNVRVWISTDPTATYNSVAGKCKATSSSTPTIATGPGGCPISDSNPVYYMGIAYDAATAYRFQVDISPSDFY